MSHSSDKRRTGERARRAIRHVLIARGHADPKIGRVRRLGGGLARDVYVAEVDPLWEDQGSTLVVAVVPHQRFLDGEEDRPARILREVRLLEWLGERELPFRIPRVVGVDSEDDSRVAVLEFLDGGPVDLRARKLPGGRPWELVGPIAAQIHGLELTGLDGFDDARTCREHGEQILAELACLEGAEEREVRDALAWAGEHLPPPEPAVLLHGDLLGQNILLGLGFLEGSDDRPGVIDWERACIGDPAYDLAVITRGVRRPFQVAGGMQLLLDEYNRRAPRPLEEQAVRLHEIYMQLGWIRQLVAGVENTPPLQQILPRLRGLVR